MIQLSGQEPDGDIPIAFVGARPGEKLHEELWNEGEDVGPTSHPKIMRRDGGRRSTARGSRTSSPSSSASSPRATRSRSCPA